jgi:N-acetylglucosamine kinase-like BadF-type ATPase
MAKVYGAGRAQVAALTPVVIAAATQGDAVAIDILQRAGDELARLAADLQQRLPDGLPVAFSGGIAQHASIVAERVKQTLALPVQVVTARADLAAARLALSHVT